MSAADIAGAVSLWAHRTRRVQAAILIGSQARPPGDPAGPDASSDWDFQLIATRPADFRRPQWVDGLGCGSVRSFVVRRALWQGGLKLSLGFPDAEVDFMILPSWPLRRLHWLSRAGCHRRDGATRRALQGLIHYVRPSWRFLKDPGWVGRLYRRAEADLPDPRLSDAAIRQLSAEFECDCRRILRRLDRGELAAAQRSIHLELAEVNFSLQHELRLRRGEVSFEKGRRLEQLGPEEDRVALTISAACTPDGLRAAAARAAATCRRLRSELLGGFPASPPFPRHSGAEATRTPHNEQPANSVM